MHIHSGLTRSATCAFLAKASLLAGVAALTMSAAFALPRGVKLSKDKLTVSISFAPGEAPRSVPNHLRKPGAVLNSDFAYKYPLGLYNCCTGWTVSGPSSVVGESIWTARPFTPTVTATSTGISAAVGYITGQNSVRMGIWSDAGGVPGVELSANDIPGSLPEFGSCCYIATFNSKDKNWKEIVLNAGTQYWLVVGTDANSQNTWAAANWETPDQQSDQTEATSYDQGQTWILSYTNLTGAAGAAYGR